MKAGRDSKLYDYRWQQARLAFLAEHPLCECQNCQAGMLRVKEAKVVDHIKPHRGDPRLFWDRSNWQAMAQDCHDSWKQQKERSGIAQGCDERGLPLDPDHPWYESSAPTQ